MKPPNRREDTLEQWVSNRFGSCLFNQFFKTYTEKVWGVPCSELRAEWAAQRIKGLSFFSRREGRLLRQQGQQDQEPDRASSTTRASAPARCGRDDAPRSRSAAARCG